jgi:predicted HTH domain antitoxin
MREEELLQEIALLLYQKERLTLTQANRLVRTRRFAILAVTPHR